MINGAHVIIYSKDTEADKAFFRDVLKFGHIDVGNGRLFFKLRHPTSRFTNPIITMCTRSG